MRFAKAHGLGNDFILVEAGECPAEASAWARRLCDRHQGVGGDGVLVWADRRDGVSMRLLNADGSEAEISGNGVRCLAAWAFRQGKVPARHVVHTGAGPRAVEVTERGNAATDESAPRSWGPLCLRVTTDLGVPRASAIDHPLEAAGQSVKVTALSLGNPHCVVFVDAPAEDALVATLGPALERHSFFPGRTNVEFVTVRGPREVRARFWERGVGPTRASGTGAASAAVASILTGRTERVLRVVCDGGVLEVEWPEGGSIRQVGDVEILFEGEWLAGAGA